MLVLLSPAKKQDFDHVAPIKQHSRIPFPKETATLVEQLRQCTPEDLKALMGISQSLAELNVNRYLGFDTEHYTIDNSKQALFAFQGDVYRSLDANTLPTAALDYAQQHLGILSGLYGLLRPLDLIQPHRLEMGTSLVTQQGNSLYEFWSDQIAELINRRLSENPHATVINLASKEYAKAIPKNALNARWLTIDFKEHRDGKYKTIGILAKRARGTMARYIIEQQLSDPEAIKQFDLDGYQYNGNLSKPDHWVFSR